ncbi:uncharacterized protein METZ01_LOCUS295577, partial [marine metagenome]
MAARLGRLQIRCRQAGLADKSPNALKPVHLVDRLPLHRCSIRSIAPINGNTWNGTGGNATYRTSPWAVHVAGKDADYLRMPQYNRYQTRYCLSMLVRKRIGSGRHVEWRVMHEQCRRPRGHLGQGRVEHCQAGIAKVPLGTTIVGESIHPNQPHGIRLDCIVHKSKFR